MDWESVKSGKKQLPAYKHIEAEHTRFNPKKSKKGVFYGNPKEKIELAWEKAHKLEINPITKQEWEKGVQKNYDYYIVPFENAGYEYSGGMAKPGEMKVLFPNTNCDYITIVTEAGTNRLKTAYPSSSTANLPVFEKVKK